MKKAVVLPFVLMFILSFSILVVNFVERTSHIIKQNPYQDIIISNTAINSIKATIKQALAPYNEVPDKELLDVLGSITTTDKKNIISMSVKVKEVPTLVNINRMFKYNQQFKQWKLKDDIRIWLVDTLSLKYELSEPYYLILLLENTLNHNSEIVSGNFRYNEGKIYSLKHFYEMVDYYKYFTSDEMIDKIKFEKIFSFDDDNSTMYCEDITEPIKKLISDDYDVDSKDIDCLDPTSTVKTKLNSLGIKHSTEYKSQRLAGEIMFESNNRKKIANFVYDFKKKEITNFDIRF
ncbi:MAG: hypothetical protein DRG11_04935 [Epsilonproteobacteria bacterium]|nr:MAG: hypothetical protein DRG11_04935 [Campylobacterota bacterium]